MLLFPPHLAKGNAMLETLGETQGPNGLLAQFLQDFGPTMMQKYKPRAIVVLSAHYETEGGGVVTDYGDENPLLYDCELPCSLPSRCSTEKEVQILTSAFF